MVNTMKERSREFSGGGQGNGPKPPPKIQGSTWRGNQEKKKNIPPPQKQKFS
jgi:hypothetical protein